MLSLLVVGVFCLRHTKVFTAPPQNMAGGPPLEDIFKDFDFNKFMEQLDVELEKIEKEEAAAGKAPAKLDSLMDTTPSRPGVNGKLPSPQLSTVQPDNVSDDPVQLVLNPPIVTVTRAGKTTLIPHEKADAAIIKMVQEFLHYLESINKKALTITSQEFNEFYHSALGNRVDLVVVMLNLILDKKVYRTVLAAPPDPVKADMTAFRKELVNGHKALKKLDESLIVTEDQEIEEELKEMEAARNLAKKPVVRAAPEHTPTPKKALPKPAPSQDSVDQGFVNQDPDWLIPPAHEPAQGFPGLPMQQPDFTQVPGAPANAFAGVPLKPLPAMDPKGDHNIEEVNGIDLPEAVS